jgi:hypothetical protein
MRRSHPDAVDPIGCRYWHGPHGGVIIHRPPSYAEVPYMVRDAVAPSEVRRVVTARTWREAKTALREVIKT